MRLTMKTTSSPGSRIRRAGHGAARSKASISKTVHLLRYVAQPRRRFSSWLATIGEERTQITTVIDDSPSLRSFPRRSWDSAMPKRDRGPLWRPSCPKMPFRSIVHLSCRSCSDPAGSIRVNAIRPGIVVDTAMRTSLEGQQRHWGLPQTAGREQLIPLGTVSVPDDVARVAAFLGSDEAVYITSESINL